MKTCIDCKFHKMKREGGHLSPFVVHRCGLTGETDVVTGNQVGMRQCSSERKNPLFGKPRCGPDASNFEPRVSA